MTSENNFINYFFVKVGTGNKYLPPAIEIAKNNENKSIFWVGYKKDDPNQTNSNNIPEVNKNNLFSLDKDQEMKIRDLYYLTLISKVAEYRKSTRLITYTEESLQIWEIVDAVRMINDSEIMQILDELGKKRKIKEKEVYSELQSKALPVRREKEIKRYKLPACIDSLRVNSFLNRGTFRYIFSTNQEENGFIEDSIKDSSGLKRFLSREKVKIYLTERSKKNEYYESYFACYVRKYFDWVRNDDDKSFTDYYSLEKSDINKLVLLTMSPAQLETAAMIFALSIGLQPDVGIGKALDAIDVRSSIRYADKDEWKNKICEIIEHIQKIMGNPLPDNVKEKMFRFGSLSFQCKNYGINPEDWKDNDFLVFAPFIKKENQLKSSTITLEDIKSYLERDNDKKELTLFRDWLKLLVFYFTNNKKELEIIF